MRISPPVHSCSLVATCADRLLVFVAHLTGSSHRSAYVKEGRAERDLLRILPSVVAGFNLLTAQFLVRYYVFSFRLVFLRAGWLDERIEIQHNAEWLDVREKVDPSQSMDLNVRRWRLMVLDEPVINQSVNYPEQVLNQKQVPLPALLIITSARQES
jgi:hypothetical protein